MNGLNHLIFYCAKQDHDHASTLLTGMIYHEERFYPIALSGTPEHASFFDSLHPLAAPSRDVWHCLFGLTFNHEKFRSFLASIAWRNPTAVGLLFVEEGRDMYFSLPSYLEPPEAKPYTQNPATLSIQVFDNVFHQGKLFTVTKIKSLGGKAILWLENASEECEVPASDVTSELPPPTTDSPF